MAKPAASARSRAVLGAITVLVGLTAAFGLANRPGAVAVHVAGAVAAANERRLDLRPAAPTTGPAVPPSSPAHLRDVDLSVVPEPSTLSLFAFGSLFLLRPADAAGPAPLPAPAPYRRA